MDPVILHVDMNNFFASVECLLNSSIAGKPMAVAGDISKRHGIILAKNELAKRFGIQTGSTIWQAKQKCPDLILVPPQHEIYKKYSRLALMLYEQYTDQIEPYGIDEAWLDVTGSLRLLGSPEEIAEEIRNRVKAELGLTVSIGVSWNKIFAKIGSDMKKPDAVTRISKSNYQQCVWSLPLQSLIFAGRSTQSTFGKYGIHTIGALAQCDVTWVKQIAGKYGEMLWIYANGMDVSTVAKYHMQEPIKSIGNSVTTPKDIVDNDGAWQTFLSLAQHVGERARVQCVKAGTLSISIRESSRFLRSFERQCKLPHPTNLTLELAKSAQQLFVETYPWIVPVRSLGIRLTDLRGSEQPEQLDFGFDVAKRDKQEQLEQTVDGINTKYGHGKIKRAILMKE